MPSPDHRRVGVYEAGNDTVLVDKFITKNDLRHVYGVLRPFRGSYRAHEWLVAITDMRVDHIEMTFVDGEVDRFADRATGVVHIWRHVRQLYKVPEIVDGRVTTSFIQTADEGRPVCGHKHRVFPTDVYTTLWIAGVLHVLRGRGRLNERPA